MKVIGIRGAVQVKKNTPEIIKKASMLMMRKIVSANKIKAEDVACVIFTMTSDLNTEFPAYAIRDMKKGWEYVPLLCAKELDVTGSMPRVIRILALVNSDLSQKDVCHQYLGAAKVLRKDLANALMRKVNKRVKK